MELTQEHFDAGLGNLLERVTTKEDLFKLEVNMATKDDLKAQTFELKQYTTESFETQQVWMKERFK